MFPFMTEFDILVVFSSLLFGSQHSISSLIITSFVMAQKTQPCTGQARGCTEDEVQSIKAGD